MSNDFHALILDQLREIRADVKDVREDVAAVKKDVSAVQTDITVFKAKAKWESRLLISVWGALTFVVSSAIALFHKT